MKAKYENFNIFQLCSVIFPTMITKVQIINLSAYSTYSVKFLAFHLERFRNYKCCVEWKQNMKIWTFSNSAQPIFQLRLPQCKSSIYQPNLHNLLKFQLSILNSLEMARPCLYNQKSAKTIFLSDSALSFFPTMITEVQIISASFHCL